VRKVPNATLFVTALVSAIPRPAMAQTGQLTLDAVLEEARQANPRLEALQASARAAGLRVPAASTLPDPAFQMGFMNLALPDLSSTMAMSMAPSLQLMQSVPFPGKLGLREELASLDAAMADDRVEEGLWQIRQRVTEIFFDLYDADRRLEVQRETLTLLEDLETIAKARYAAGTGRQSDVLLANVGVSKTEADIRRLVSRRTGHAARLNALLARASDAPVPVVALPALPATIPPPDVLIEWAEASRPLLEHARTRAVQADTRVRLAARDAWPDLMVGVHYGQRDRGAGAGTERMGGASIGFTLPIFAGRRQGPEREAAEALAMMSQADLSETRAEVAARILELDADLREVRDLIRLYRQEILPQARAATESALSSYRVGELEFSTVLDAELAVNRFRLELHTLVHDYGTSLAALEAQVGRELPRAGAELLEVS
jgi:outer membrane protein TolC